MRFLVPAGHHPGGLRAGAQAGAAAGADHGVCVLPLADRGADPTRTAADLFAGWWQLITGVGAVPRVLVWDGEGAIAGDIGQRRLRTAMLGVRPQATRAWRSVANSTVTS